MSFTVMSLGRFGVPYKGAAVIGAGVFGCVFWGFDLVLGITVVLRLIIFWSFFPLFVAIFCAEHRHKRISTAHERSELAKQSGLVVYVKKGVDCLELAPFGEFEGTNFYKIY